MIILIKTLQVILALSILIIVHEFGHFIWARIFGIRVEKFYLFFDIGGKAIARWKWGDTEFGIGWLPFGGYCKISGMIDESMDMEQMKRDPEKWEFRTHPAWQRLFVMAGGVVNNLIFAVIAYIVILAVWGQSFIPNEGNSIYVNDLAYEMGFRNGDRIISYDDYIPEDFSMLQADLARKEAQYAHVIRGADTLNLYIDQAMIPDVLNSPMMFDIAIPFIIDSISTDGLNFNSGLRKDDRIISLDGHRVDYLQDSRDLLASLKGRDIEAGIVRGADTLSIPVKIDTSGRIGIYMKMPEVERRTYNIAEAVPAGIKMTVDNVSGYLDDLKMMFKPSTGAYKSVGSFIAIGQVFPSTWDWFRFMNIIALLSIMLAVMNLLPIPGLDGGHILFTLYEIFTGRKPGEKFLIAAQIIGMAIIFGLMILAMGNDISRLF